MQVARPQLTWYEKIYIPSILGGMIITFKHFFRSLFFLTFRIKKRKRTLLDLTETGATTMQYPEEKWPLPPHYRGAPTLVKDEDGREKCVSCQLCEFVCPPRAIKIIPGELPADSRFAKVEKGPEEFDIDMIRCIYCGLCEEVCPEEAIFLLDEYAIVGSDRASMVHNKEKLYELGGTLKRPIKKWENK